MTIQYKDVVNILRNSFANVECTCSHCQEKFIQTMSHLDISIMSGINTEDKLPDITMAKYSLCDDCLFFFTQRHVRYVSLQISYPDKDLPFPEFYGVRVHEKLVKDKSVQERGEIYMRIINDLFGVAVKKLEWEEITLADLANGSFEWYDGVVSTLPK